MRMNGKIHLLYCVLNLYSLFIENYLTIQRHVQCDDMPILEIWTSVICHLLALTDKIGVHIRYHYHMCDKTHCLTV